MLALLVTSRFELDERCDLLAPFRGPDQRSTIALSPEVRYRVSLIARTCGSAAAWRTNSSTVARSLVGMMHEHVPRADRFEDVDLAFLARHEGLRRDGEYTGSFRSERSSAWTDHSPARSSGPTCRYDVVVFDVELPL